MPKSIRWGFFHLVQGADLGIGTLGPGLGALQNRGRQISKQVLCEERVNLANGFMKKGRPLV